MICVSCQFDTESAAPCECGAALCMFCRQGHTCPVPEAPPLWPHQQRALKEYYAAVEAGENALCITAPTGGGKTRLIMEIAAEARKHYRRVVIYTNRKLLTTQSSGVLDTFGVRHGIMAAGHDPALLQNVQIASIQTIDSRVYQQQRWDLHPADVVIVDECHNNVNPTALKIIADHQAQGAVLLGFTATPVGLEGIYKKLIVAGTNSELRACGALLPCVTYGPDEPDLKHVKRDKVGEYVQGGVAKAIMVQSIFGRVYKWLIQLNPNLKPTILFAPGVKESMFFVEDLRKRGITADHIDAKTPDDEREDIIEGSREGRIRVVCNRFVLREGIDMPWLAHCIMAPKFGAMSNFLQAGGRLLRAYPGLDQVTLQCHGGSFHAHGSLNADRVWTLGDTDRSIAKQVTNNRVAGNDKDPEPIRCPKCSGVRMSGPQCPFCGHKHKQSVRIVIQKDGELTRKRGNVTKKKKKKQVSRDQKLWDRCYYQAFNSKNRMNFNQAAARFFRETQRQPPSTLNKVPPTGHVDWDRAVRVVTRKDMSAWRKKDKPPLPATNSADDVNQLLNTL